MKRRTKAKGARRSGDSRGMTLVEMLVGLFLMTLGVLAAAPMFLAAAEESAVSADLGSVGAVANERMELLRAERWRNLPPGGSLNADVPGYFDASDPDFTVRWTIENNVTPTGSRTISVRATATRQVVGRRKAVTLTTIRSRG